MTAKEKKIRKEDKSSATGYLKKASDNYDQMLVAFNASNWNTAATPAVQCAISSADAICVCEKGVRSASQDHLDVCDFVKQIPVPGASEMVKVTARVYQWVREKMGQ